MQLFIIRWRFFALAVAVGAAWSSGETQGATVSLTASHDTTLYEDTDGALANGSGEYLFAGRTNTPTLRRALFWFDIASMIPDGATITSASLVLHLSGSASDVQTMALHTVLADWGEGESNAGFPGGSGAPPGENDATWIHTFFDTEFWATPGGDFNPMESAAMDVGFTQGFVTWQSATMAEDVQNWLEHPTDNHGWILLGNEEVDGSAKRFDSRESLTEAFRPQLVLEYSAVPTPGGLGVLVIGWISAGRGRRRRTG